jgi:hypothetical protein
LDPAVRGFPAQFARPVSVKTTVAAAVGVVGVVVVVVVVVVVEMVGGHPAALEDTVHKHVGVLGIDLPEAPLPRLVLLPGHLEEALVEGQVVADGVLQVTTQEEEGEGTG